MEILIYGAMRPKQLHGEATGHHMPVFGVEYAYSCYCRPTTPGDEGHVGDPVPGNAIFDTNGQCTVFKASSASSTVVPSSTNSPSSPPSGQANCSSPGEGLLCSVIASNRKAVRASRLSTGKANMIMMAAVNSARIFSLPTKWKGSPKESWGNVCGSLIGVQQGI
jgi:hypothetical protein